MQWVQRTLRLGSDHLIFEGGGGGGGGGKIILGLDFFLRAQDPGFFFARHLEFFSARVIHIKTKQKRLLY